jgi:3-deoxy-7-phosphoheptulonate synthase
VVAGLNAVDTREYVERTFAALRDAGQACARMGAYKPRTSPYSFQGYGRQCLPYVFELAGKYDVRVVAMEVTHDEHVEEIREALRAQHGRVTHAARQLGLSSRYALYRLMKKHGIDSDPPPPGRSDFDV